MPINEQALLSVIRDLLAAVDWQTQQIDALHNLVPGAPNIPTPLGRTAPERQATIHGLYRRVNAIAQELERR